MDWSLVNQFSCQACWDRYDIIGGGGDDDDDDDDDDGVQFDDNDGLHRLYIIWNKFS